MVVEQAPEPGPGTGPDFVCIGAQRAGTTWLYDNLVVHPRTWLPPVKEVHFFDSLCPNEELLGVETSQDPQGPRKYAPILTRPSLHTVRWIHRYYHEHRTTGWYYRIFEKPSPGLVAGDITPAYSTLDDRGVRFASRVLAPACRVFMVLRNPMERAWSGLKMTYRFHGRDISGTDLERLTRGFDHPTHRLRSDYVGAVRRWSEAFPGRFRTFLYDDLEDDPRVFLYDVQDHLRLERFAREGLLGQRSNADRRSLGMPLAVREVLRARYAPLIRELETLVPGVAERWLQGD